MPKAKREIKRNKKAIVKSEVDWYINVISLIKNGTDKDKTDELFSSLEKKLRPKIRKIVNKYNITGMSTEDIYQEALYALRYKALKDYDSERTEEPYPFDRFASLCIRRHLSTVLQVSQQQKQKTLNTSISLSLSTDYSDDNGYGSTCLSDILPFIEGDIDGEISNKEYFKEIYRELYSRLSDFEKEVFWLYTKKYSYREMVKIIKHNRKKREAKKKGVVNTKSIDNCLMRIKTKANRLREERLKEKEERNEE